MSIMLANFGKYAISDYPFIALLLELIANWVLLKLQTRHSMTFGTIASKKARSLLHDKFHTAFLYGDMMHPRLLCRDQIISKVDIQVPFLLTLLNSNPSMEE